ncbi:hypothetical protein G9A89_001800 [Geosiphon pyriformis]|nr:hypothetical protein G9A89_001800 [Geosiphon pyriformis]
MRRGPTDVQRVAPLNTISALRPYSPRNPKTCDFSQAAGGVIHATSPDRWSARFMERGPIPLSHADVFNGEIFRARFEHSNFLKVKGLGPGRKGVAPFPPSTPLTRVNGKGRGTRGRRWTSRFLTATALIYAIGAGITAAAGTRLALQSLLVRGFEPCSFRLRGSCRDPHRYLLSLPPRVGIGPLSYHRELIGQEFE